MATATAPAITREILEERWNGLMIMTNPMSPMHDRPHVENSKLYDQLDRSLRRLVYGLVRSDTEQEATDRIIERLYASIREGALSLVGESGIADNPA